MPAPPRGPLLLVILLLTLALAASIALALVLWNGARSDGGAPATPQAAPGPPVDRRSIPPVSDAAWTPHPASRLPLRVIDYPHFTIGYDEQAKSLAWAAYPLDGPIRFHERIQRPLTFATEFRTAAHVAHRDYSGSGFDRGHMCPAFALASRFGEEAMRATFVMSNVIPQYHGLNAGEWEALECDIAGREREGGWAARYGPLWIINGPVYGARPAQQRLRNGTWIPDACFSVVLRHQAGRWEALAFTMPNQPVVAGPLDRFLTTIATIDRATGLDLLAGLEGREAVETQRAAGLWR